ncbi:MAG: pyridoxal phosphate-dependent aminotransferase [Firmicutes bacterium]|nr:pyridoxal phosphate-dependent aminotransferase [Bacillota bacterium]
MLKTLSLAERVRQLHPSPTMAIDSKAKSLIAEGKDVVNFGAGEPDFDTPENIRQAAITAINHGQTRYTAVGGIEALKAAIQERIRLDTGLEYHSDEILVSVGAKHSLYNAIMALVDPQDGVLLPVPYWVTYPEQIALAGGVAQYVVSDPKQEGAVHAEDIANVLTDRSRGLLLNSPSNPSGAVINPPALAQIARLVSERDLWVISDEIYNRLVYDDATHVSIASFPGMRERTILINGVSKSYAMTGWRIGYAAGPQHIIKAMTSLQSQSTSNPSTMAQYAALEALTGPQEQVEVMRREFDRRRQYIVGRINQISGLSLDNPKGAFYVWVNMAAYKNRKVGGRLIKNADDLALVWLEQANVAVVPGSGFGMPEYFRISYATSMERIETGLNRMQSLLESTQ